MTRFKEPFPGYDQRIRQSFELQRIMNTLGATLTKVEPGRVEIELPFRKDLSQQHGFLHAGAITTIVDSACGYAAYSLMPEEAEVLAVEFKVNFLAPALGEKFLAVGEVFKAGKTLTIARGDVTALQADGSSRQVAAMQSTIMNVRGRVDATP